MKQRPNPPTRLKATETVALSVVFKEQRHTENERGIRVFSERMDERKELDGVSERSRGELRGGGRIAAESDCEW